MTRAFVRVGRLNQRLSFVFDAPERLAAVAVGATTPFLHSLPCPGPVPALVIEGGAMRAAYSSGVLAAFEEAGHHPWDAVYGMSAGGVLAGWFSAGQARYALGTWHDATDPRILSYGRWLTSRARPWTTTRCSASCTGRSARRLGSHLVR